MAIDYHHLKGRHFAPVRQQYTTRDSMLYALSLGLGNNPLDTTALPYVYEGRDGNSLKTVPSQAVVLGYPGFWAREPDTGIDWVKLLHGEQRMRLHQPLPAAADVVGYNQITHLTDKGDGKGAIMVTERRLETADGQLLATVQQVSFLRGDGGFSANGAQPSDAPLPPLQAVPEDRAPDFVDTQSIRPEAALLYRLCGDYNPLHADPAVAQAAGFERPILHGLASYGLVTLALLRQCAGGDAARFRALDIRFTSPVFPGETLVTEIWHASGNPNLYQLRARVLERDKIVLSHGLAELA
ncbi:MAG TPA: MaoC/PaaZ C-terminal domain-containing protein [Comamonas sp.]